MKRILRSYLVNTSSLYAASLVASGLVFEKGWESVLLTGVGLTVATLLVKPIINVLLLPINLITFNLFKWVSSGVAIFLVTLVVPGFKILYFHFPGLSSKWLDIPAISLDNFLKYIAFSFIIFFISSLLHWIINK